MRGTVFEKIIKRHADSNIQVIPDEVISISIDHILIPDNSIMPIFDLLEHSHMHIKHQNVYVALTNYHYQYEPNYGAKQRKIIDAVRKHGFNILENYQGVWNINFLQNDKVRAGDTFLARDSTVNFFAPLNNLNISSGIHDVFQAIITGKYDYMIPEIIRVNLVGKLDKKVSGKNLALFIKRELSSLTQHRPYLLEFAGDILSELTANDLFTLSLHHYTMNRAAFIFPALPQFKNDELGIKPDVDAEYSRIFTFDVTNLPEFIDNNGCIMEANDNKGKPLDKVYIGNSVGGMLDDFEFLASVLKNRKVKIPTFIMPSSSAILYQAVKRGYLEAILESGCILAAPSTGLFSAINDLIPLACDKILATGYNDLSAQVRDSIAEFYNASISVAVASAVNGFVSTMDDI